MHITRSSFYAWRDSLRCPCSQKKKLAQAVNLFMEYHHKFPSHGYRWLNAKIRLDRGLLMSDPYALKCCQIGGIRSEAKRCKGFRSPGNPYRLYPNILLSSLNITGPLQCIVSDMTAFHAKGHYYELTLYMDLWNNEIIAYALSGKRGDRMTYLDGLKEVVKKKDAEPFGCTMILHSDQGSVYASKEFNENLALHNIIRSMSRAGTPTDNGAMESINGWIKEELFTDFHITGKKSIYKEIAEYIRFFNEKRPAYSLHYLTPKQYREQYAPTKTA